MDDRVLEIILRARDDASKTLQKVGKEVGSLGDLLAGWFHNAAIISGAAIGALGFEAVRAVGAFQDSQAAIAQLDTVLKSTGHTAGLFREDILEQATARSPSKRFRPHSI